MSLPNAFLDRPIAHRALHDVTDGRPENSREAIEAAIAAGYGIEIDVQPSRDGAAMVFHDYDLGRLAGIKGPIAQRGAPDLASMVLVGGGSGIPTLPDVLELVSGQVPLLIEIKDQDGAMGENVGHLEAAVAEALSGYSGDAALMSFNPHSVACFQTLCPERPRGLVTCGYDGDDWPLLSAERRTDLTDIPDYTRVGACFISHDRKDLQNPAVARLKADGAGILTWTIKNAAQEAEARKIVDNITFEQYLA